MQILDNLTSDAYQQVTFVLPDGSLAQLQFNYQAGTQRWALDISHPLLTLRGVNLVQSPNILRQWKNLIPFGMAILSSTGLDPMAITDLSNGTITVEMLTAQDVLDVESTFMAPVALVNA